MSKIVEGHQEYSRYRSDTQSLRKITRKIRAKGSTATRIEEQTKYRNLVQSNALHQLSEEGLNALIVEDLNEASTDGYVKRLQRYLQTDKFTKYTDRVPNSIGSIANTLWMTKNSGIYKVMKDTVALTDFLARYVQVEYATSVQGQDFQKAKHTAVKDFILFDENSSPAQDFMESSGLVMFSTYWLRVQPVIRRLLQQNPAGAGVAIGAELAGVPGAAGIFPSSLLTNAPNVLAQPDAFSSMFDIPLFEAIFGTLGTSSR